MLLEDRNAVIYGGGGSIGGAVAHAFAQEGARVFLAGRTQEMREEVAEQIRSAGGVAKTAKVDALDEQAVEKHIGEVVEQAGSVDVSLNAISIRNVQLISLRANTFTTYPIVGSAGSMEKFKAQAAFPTT